MSGLGFLVGLGFGVLMAAARLTDPTVIRDMLLLREGDVFFLMGGAIAVASPILFFLCRSKFRSLSGQTIAPARTPIAAHHVWGGALFGLGWAVSAACPGPVLVMIGQGRVVPGLVIAAGIALGVYLRDRTTAA